MSSIPCDIVLLPSDEIARRAVKMSADLQKFGALFQLGDSGPFPHISLYMTQLKVGDIGKVEEILADIAARTPRFDLKAMRYDQAEGYIDADYTRTDDLDRLQMTIIEAINPLRDGMREKDKARMLNAEGKARENLEKYGYRGVGELFRPHVTFTRFKDSRAIDTDILQDPRQFSGQFVKLGLFEMGDNGTCTKQLATFELEGAK